MADAIQSPKEKKPSRLPRITAIVFVALLGLASFYFAAAGWVIANLDSKIVTNTKEGEGPSGEVVYKGISFKNIYEARQAIEQDKVSTLFEWTYYVPASLPLMITAISFGILGGIANVVHKAIRGFPQTTQRLVFKPLFGAFIGLMVLGITYVLPALLTVNDQSVRPIALAFLCLYAGAFSNHVYVWLEEKIKTLFTLEKKISTDTSFVTEKPKP